MAAKTRTDEALASEAHQQVLRTHQLVSQVRSLADNLNKHLDEVQALITERRKTL